MASYIVAVVGLMLTLSCITFSSAKVYTVGDSAGWALSVDYTTWASDKTFNVGDKLGKYLFTFVTPTMYNKKDIYTMIINIFLIILVSIFTLTYCYGQEQSNQII